MSCSEGIQTFSIGQSVTLRANFWNVADELYDPTVVVFKYRKPGETESVTKTFDVDDEVKQDLTGKYHLDVKVDTAGTWFWSSYSLESDPDEPAAASQREFVVARSLV